MIGEGDIILPIMKTWFTSDQHFGHGNIIKYCNRTIAAPAEEISRWTAEKTRVPKEAIDRMNEEMIRRFQERVGPHDRVYFLGDFCFAKKDRAADYAMSILSRLPGEHFFVPGNHDDREVINLDHWKDVSPLMDIRVDGHRVTLCHYMMKVWNKAHHGALQLFGHSHGSMAGTSQQCDVGVDAFDYAPVQLSDCLSRMKKFPKWASDDHHQYRE